MAGSTYKAFFIQVTSHEFRKTESLKKATLFEGLGLDVLRPLESNYYVRYFNPETDNHCILFYVFILTRFAHVEKSRPEQELSRLAVPVAPGAQETDVLLDLHVLASAEQKLLKKPS